MNAKEAKAITEQAYRTSFPAVEAIAKGLLQRADVFIRSAAESGVEKIDFYEGDFEGWSGTPSINSRAIERAVAILRREGFVVQMNGAKTQLFTVSW